MIPVTEYYTKAVTRPNRDIRCKAIVGSLTLIDDDILSYKITDSLLGTDIFDIGGTASTHLELILSTAIAGINHSNEYTGTDFNNFNFENQELILYTGLLLNTPNAESTRNVEYVPMGIFTIETVLKNDTDKTITLKGFDRMVKFEKEYTSALTYPNTVLNIYKEICNNSGVSYSSESFINSDLVVPSKVSATGLTNRMMLGYVAEVAAANAIVNRYGQVELRTLGDNSVATVDKSNYFTLNNAELQQGTIDIVKITKGDVTVTEGTGINSITVTNNPLINTPSEAITGISTELLGMNYWSFKSKWNGNPAVEVGDKITIDDGNNIYFSYITHQSIEYLGGYKANIEAVGRSASGTSTATVGSIKTQVGKNTAEIAVVQDEISMKVSRGEDLNNEIYTQVTQNAESWKLSIDGKLKGKTYTFDDTAFYIGGTGEGEGQSGARAEHTNNYSKWIHADGGVTEVGEEGFYYRPLSIEYDGKTNFAYHSLIKTNIETVTSNATYQTVGINIGDEFIGKDYTKSNVVASIEYAENTTANQYTVYQRKHVYVSDVNSSYYDETTGETKAMIYLTHSVRADVFQLVSVKDINNNTVSVMKLVANDVNVTGVNLRWIIIY